MIILKLWRVLMSDFSMKSRASLITCHRDLQALAHKVIRVHDCSVITGFRAEEMQRKMFATGLSKVQFPNSKHNLMPAKAIDLAPYPVNWKDIKSFYYFAGIVMGVASEMNLRLRWGGDWDLDNDLNDQRFNDLIHFELL